MGAADGLQKTARPLSNARHYSNTLFNVMRGGIFNDGYKLDPDDLLAFVTHANKKVAVRHAPFFRRLPKPTLYGEMVAAAAATGDPQLERLCREYLPLTFSRRHGDPSRPWNRFSIATRNADGTRILNYEGNWRDIFQNWEALAVSFPGFVSGMICRFLNASTADGYNPYRITRDGIDWEVVDPHDPWSYIGYWGDHQIIYLLKLLEILDRHDPATLPGLLTRDLFAYANVPYRIKPYDALLANPKDTVVFDPQIEALVQQRVRAVGADGKLVWDKHGQVRLVNLTEKLLVPLLAKLSNFIPEAGIWLNTQRPEWNDANNALVGNGASMVTLYYLRRHLTFCRELFRAQADANSAFPPKSPHCFGALNRILDRHRRLLAGTFTDHQRHRVLDDLGRAGSHYRQRIYQHGLSGRKTLDHGPTIDRVLRLGAGVDQPFHSGQSPARRAFSRLQSRPVREPDSPSHPPALRNAGGPGRRAQFRPSLGRGIAGSAHRAQAQFDVSRRSTQLPALSRPAAPGLCRKKQHSREGNSSLARCCGNCWPTATGNSSNATLPDEFTSTAPSPTPATSAASWSNSPPAVMPDW